VNETVHLGNVVWMLVKVCVHWQWALLEVERSVERVSVLVHTEVVELAARVELERREVAVEAVLMWNQRQLVCWYCCLTVPFSSFLICHSWPFGLVKSWFYGCVQA